MFSSLSFNFGKNLFCCVFFLFASPWELLARELPKVSGKGSYGLRDNTAYSQEDEHSKLSEVLIYANQMLGSKFRAQNRTGSAYYLSSKELQKFGYTDINRMLKAVPGVNIYEEDGFGLRPNISMRGTDATRSSRISLMEDGVLASPAPYASPAAYYFPNAARMYAIEILKGGSQVQYGPFTTGGAINMVSTPIPQKFSARLNTSYGIYNTFKAHAVVGDSRRFWGYMVEYLRYQSDGFKKFTNGGKKPGFYRDDVVAKLRVKTDRQGLNHALELKFGFAHEFSRESYLGLTEADFNANPYQKYPSARNDYMRFSHYQGSLTYFLVFPDNLKITTTAYINRFTRNWYKLEDVRVGHLAGEKRSIAQILADPITNHLYYDIMAGRKNYIGEALIVRASARDYPAKGIQSKLEWNKDFGETHLDLQAGLRYHTDAEGRNQWEDGYSMYNGQMSMFLPGIPGSQQNRILSARAFSSYVLALIKVYGLTISAGLRYEDVNLLNKDFGKKDIYRTGMRRQEIANQARALIPSLGLSYKIMPEITVFTGVHKGFAPPSAVLYQKAESSINVEAGLRMKNKSGNLRTEIIGFYNYYFNMLGNDLLASGGSGNAIQFNVGRAQVRGLEALINFQPMPQNSIIKLPIQISYTYTNTAMLNSFVSSTWGYVSKGDAIPYITEHIANLNMGLSYKDRYELNIGTRYTGNTRSQPGQGAIPKSSLIPANLIIDLGLKAQINKYLSITANIINATNRKYLASRHPAGLRPGHPFGIYSGIILNY